MDYDLIGKMTPTELLIEAGRRIGVKSITESQLHEFMMALAERHANEQAKACYQSHNGFNGRASEVMAKFGGGTVSEIVAESWPNQNENEAAEDAWKDWKQSPGHWREANSPHSYYGYSIAKGKNNIWYSCGIFVNSASDI